MATILVQEVKASTNTAGKLKKTVIEQLEDLLEEFFLI
jgi:hypothetical protein